MKLPQLKDLVEIVGILAIVVSLVIVGFELRQSHQIAIASHYQERTDSGRQYFYEVLDSEYRMKDVADFSRQIEWPEGFLTERDEKWLAENPVETWAEARIWANINLYGFDNYHYQYQSGFLSEEGWGAMEKRLHDMLASDPFARYEIVVNGMFYRKSFVDHALNLLDSPGPAPVHE
jgi:hypothetical protein